MKTRSGTNRRKPRHRVSPKDAAVTETSTVEFLNRLVAKTAANDPNRENQTDPISEKPLGHRSHPDEYLPEILDYNENYYTPGSC